MNISMPDMDSFLEMFPDCDPDYIAARLEDFPGGVTPEGGERFEHLAAELAEKKYPRLQNKIVKEQVRESQVTQVSGVAFNHHGLHF